VSLERIGSVREYVQTNLLNLFGARTLGPGWTSWVTRFD
jgi:hypothetical protein